jgi:seryl-tRNA synthetase
MLDIKDIITRPEWYKKQIALKNTDSSRIDECISLYQKRNALRTEKEQLQAEKNALAKELPQSLQKEEMLSRMNDLKQKLQEMSPQEETLSKELNALLLSFPNPAHDSVLPGNEDEGNMISHSFLEKPSFSFPVKDHTEIAKHLDLFDSEAGAKVAGSRFVFLKNDLVLLQFALIQYVLELTTQQGFTPLLPPHLVNEEIVRATGYLQGDHSEEVYHINPGRDDLYLIGTSEIPGVAYHANEILEENNLPKKYVLVSPCYRREAGSSGKDMTGIFRGHQFDKVEMIVFSSPKESEKEHKNLLALEEKIWQGLQIHYNVMNICGGDLGSQASKKYDIEAWLPGQDKYREMTSTSNCTDFQSRRLKIRMKTESGENVFVHTLNGTGIALSRCLIAILENHQQEDGSVKIPEVLHKWLPFTSLKKRS